MPVLEINGCMGCGNCVQVCPPDVLRLDPNTGKAFIAHQQDCQICHLCRLSCPVDAIHITAEHSVPPLVSWA